MALNPAHVASIMMKLDDSAVEELEVLVDERLQSGSFERSPVLSGAVGSAYEGVVPLPPHLVSLPNKPAVARRLADIYRAAGWSEAHVSFDFSPRRNGVGEEHGLRVRLVKFDYPASAKF